MRLDGLAQRLVQFQGQPVKGARMLRLGGSRRPVRVLGGEGEGERPVGDDALDNGFGHVVVHAGPDDRPAFVLLEDDDGVDRLAVGPG